MIFFAIIAAFGSMIVIQTRFNPNQNNLISRAGNKIIYFFEVNKKMLKKTGTIATNIFIVVCLMFLTGFYIYTLPRNSEAKKFVDIYIQHSTDIRLTYIEPVEIGLARGLPLDEFSKVHSKYSKYQIIYTGFGRIVGRRAKLSRVTYLTEIFQDKNSNKYFQFMFVGRDTQWVLDALLRDGLQIDAKVNIHDLKNPIYGTLENPIPVMTWVLPRWQGNKDYENAKITDERYRSNVYYYLAYIMSKQEFKERFVNGKGYESREEAIKALEENNEKRRQEDSAGNALFGIKY